MLLLLLLFSNFLLLSYTLSYIPLLSSPPISSLLLLLSSLYSYSFSPLVLFSRYSFDLLSSHVSSLVSSLLLLILLFFLLFHLLYYSSPLMLCCFVLLSLLLSPLLFSSSSFSLHLLCSALFSYSSVITFSLIILLFQAVQFGCLTM